MNMQKFLAAGLFGLVLTAPAYAQVRIEDPWVRATVPHQKVTGAFMRITSAEDARLVAVTSAVAGTVEIHEMTMDKDVMKMRPVQAVQLPAGRTVELGPGGHHVMLMDLRQALQPGDRVRLTLTVEGRDGKRQVHEIDAPVRPLATAGGGHHAR